MPRTENRRQTSYLAMAVVLPAVVLGSFCLVSASHFPSGYREFGSGEWGVESGTPRCGLCDMRARETKEAAAGSKQTNAGRWVAAATSEGRGALPQGGLQAEVWLVAEVIQTQDKTRRQTIQDFELVIQNAGATINGIYGRSRFSASSSANPKPKPTDRIQPKPKPQRDPFPW